MGGGPNSTDGSCQMQDCETCSATKALSSYNPTGCDFAILVTGVKPDMDQVQPMIVILTDTRQGVDPEHEIAPRKMAGIGQILGTRTRGLRCTGGMDISPFGVISLPRG